MVCGTFGGQADKDGKAFQERFKPTQDGIVGPSTRNVLIVRET
jgi:peptidoglycan hydrolase-like protein with peptidoglycan-binding domain